MDVLPDPCSAKFELDLSESTALIPVGGEIPEPRQAPEPKKPEEEKEGPPM
jgi:hypothetical protein